MQTIYNNAAKIQIRLMAWMREPEWKWHIVHTDHMADDMPTHLALPQHPSCVMNFCTGKAAATRVSQGPPKV